MWKPRIMSVMCIKYYFHFHLSVPLLHATSGYIKSNFFGFCWAKWVVFSLVMQLNMLTDLITRCHETSPCADEIQSFKVRSVSIASCFNDVWKPHTAFIFLNTFLGFCLVHGIEFVMNKWFYLSYVTFWLSFVETSLMFRVNIWSWQHILPNVLRRDHWRLEMLNSMCAFLWDDPYQDQQSEITWIMVDQMNQWILVQNGFIGSFDLPRSEWSRITDPDTDDLKGTHPCVLSLLLTVALPLNIGALQWFLPTQKINVDPRQSVNVNMF